MEIELKALWYFDCKQNIIFRDKVKFRRLKNMEKKKLPNGEGVSI